MPFLVQTLPKHQEILTTVHAPIIRGEPSRIYHTLNEKIERRSENDTIHVIMNLTEVPYEKRLPIELFVKIVGKIYENWYHTRTLVLWIAADGTYTDTVGYLVQTWCLPVYIHTDMANVYSRIDAMYGETAEFDKALKTRKIKPD